MVRLSWSIVTRGKVWADDQQCAGQLKERANPPVRVWPTGVLFTQRLARPVVTHDWLVVM